MEKFGKFPRTKIFRLAEVEGVQLYTKDFWLQNFWSFQRGPLQLHIDSQISSFRRRIS